MWADAVYRWWVGAAKDIGKSTGDLRSQARATPARAAPSICGASTVPRVDLAMLGWPFTVADCARAQDTPIVPDACVAALEVRDGKKWLKGEDAEARARRPDRESAPHTAR